jgi:thiamine-phosphate pyrophosphorylase
MTIPSNEVFRILDASLNRASEGLRVVEDYVRFALDDRHLTEQFKQIRHDLAEAGAALPWSDRHAARDTRQDVGTTINTTSEAQREDAADVCQASLERVKQSLRSLEEFGKLVTAQMGAGFESLRYRLYTLEAALGRTADAVRRLANVRLCALIDGRGSEAAFAEMVKQLISAGVDAIQLRDKKLSDRELVSRAHMLLDWANRPPTNPDSSHPRPIKGMEQDVIDRRRPLIIINDRPDIAAVVDADGVHLGQGDMSVKDARAIVGPRKLIGVSTHSIEQTRAAVLAGANYLGVGPTFPSKTKQFNSYPGLALLREVAAQIRLPAFAIGGITEENVDQVLAAGFSRIAVSSAVADAVDPASAASSLGAALQR